MDMQQAGFFIEATSHCRDGKLPRWTFWVQGSSSENGDGMIGTDRQGRGLYLYTTQGGRATAFREIVAPDALNLPDTLSRQQANQIVVQLLSRLGWGQSRAAPTMLAPVVGLHVVGTP
ncbi:MAG: hypothetical protein QM776_16180 [Rhodocyclaceae bacterium]